MHLLSVYLNRWGWMVFDFLGRSVAAIFDDVLNYSLDRHCRFISLHQRAFLVTNRRCRCCRRRFVCFIGDTVVYTYTLLSHHRQAGNQAGSQAGTNNTNTRANRLDAFLLASRSCDNTLASTTHNTMAAGVNLPRRRW